MTDTPDWITLDAYFAGKNTPDQEAMVGAWLAAHRDHPEVLEEWRQAWAAKGKARKPAWNAHTAADTVLAAVARDSAVPKTGTATTFTPHRTPVQRRGVVAGFLAVLVVAFLGFTYSTGHISLGAQVTATYVTGPAGQLTVSLNDSTRIALGPSTRLTVEGRTVVLAGLAAFTVQHKTAVPFTVIANDVKTTVLGTEFNVRAYPGDGETRVAVRTGRVAVQPRAVTVSNAVVLSQDEMIAVASSGDTRVTRGAAAARDFAWRDGKLVFLDAPLSIVLPELSRWSGWEIQVSEPALLKRPLTTTVGTTVGREELAAIADVLETRIEQDTVRRTITFVPRKSSASQRFLHE